jgi:hypothetical protein
LNVSNAIVRREKPSWRWIYSSETGWRLNVSNSIVRKEKPSWRWIYSSETGWRLNVSNAIVRREKPSWRWIYSSETGWRLNVSNKRITLKTVACIDGKVNNLIINYNGTWKCFLMLLFCSNRSVSGSLPLACGGCKVFRHPAAMLLSLDAFH